MTGATDCAFWQAICPNCVRFAPVVYGPEQMKGMHGLNENISVDCLPGAVEKGIVYGVGASRMGMVKDTPAWNEAYEMGKAL